MKRTIAYKWTPDNDARLLRVAAKHKHGQNVWWGDVEEDQGAPSPLPSRGEMQYRYYELTKKGVRPSSLTSRKPAVRKPKPELFVSNGHVSTVALRFCPNCGHDLARLLEAVDALRKIEEAQHGG